VVVVAAMTAPSSAAAQTPGCVAAIAMVGEPPAVDTIRAALGDGLLAVAPAASCEGAELAVEASDGGWHVRLVRAGRAVEHTATSAAVSASWVESWLAPAELAPVATLAVSAAAPAPVEPRDAATAAERTPEQAVTRGTPIQIAARAVGDVDTLGPVYAGGEVALHALLGPSLTAGISVAGVWTPEETDATTRRALRLVVRGGWQESLSFGTLRLGGGFGLVSAVAARTTDNGDVVQDEEAGPLMEAFGSLDVHLGATWAISIAASIRLHGPDDFGPDSGPPDPVPKPDPLSTVAGSLAIGLAWDHGRDP
jgi:hypothetical protein